jgi:iron only hydrogenase large subunit-like protein
MKKLITNDESNCTGCNRCIRVCPTEGANAVYEIDGKIKVRVDNDRCIACGACIDTCKHGVRGYVDDTERFINDLRNGVPISLFAAPAFRATGEGERILAWLRKSGVRRIYDVSLGADICTWAHMRFIQKENPRSVITQPCPAIVNHVLMHDNRLLKYLSPIHSPMLCTAIYMNKYDRVSEKIAALSPCIAKAHEFEATGYVHYNVTFKKLQEYIRQNNINLPNEHTDFDHRDSALGRLYSMPGGLKENVEFLTGKKLRIDQAEGPDIVYKALGQFADQNGSNLPAIFDVLNCGEGCNLGTGCTHDRSRFDASAVMNKGRQQVLDKTDRAQVEKLFREYDSKLNLNDFVRKYTLINIPPLRASDSQIEDAFAELNKHDHDQRHFDCSACGAHSCYEMARHIATGINLPQNCAQREKELLNLEHEKIVVFQKANLENVTHLLSDTNEIKSLSDEIVELIKSVNEAIESYTSMSKEINSIASSINMISLNASIEAARAGEHGRTFAVVAEEIRGLVGNTQKTVSQTADISSKATNSVTSINGKIASIANAIDAAHGDIESIYTDMVNLNIQ